MALSDETEDFLRRRSAGEDTEPSQHTEPAHSQVAETTPEAPLEPESPKTFSSRMSSVFETIAWLMIVVGVTNVLRLLAGGPAVESSDLTWAQPVMNFFSAWMLFISARGSSLLTMKLPWQKT